MNKEQKELAEILWTARWAVSKKQYNTAYDEITKALVRIGAEKSDEEHPTTPPPVISEPKFIEPTFVVVKGVRFKNQRAKYNTPSGTFEGLVVHYTVSGRTASSAKAVLQWLSDSNLGCMVMDENGLIYIPEGFDIFKNWSGHAGKSAWRGRSSVSQYMAGMEVCCWGLNSKVGPYRTVTTKEGYVVAGKYQQFTEAQEKSLINFILWAQSKNSAFKIENVVGHDELRREAGMLGDKQDAGGSLSMPMPKFRETLKGLL